MDLRDLSQLVSKVCGPVLIVLSPIFVLLLGLDPLGADGRGPTLREWAFLISLGCAGLYLGCYLCYKEYGWFERIFRKR